ncbi:hypothetical protein CDIK_2191 [Cucumispora dikerogammari]|nr:hypothetical protein CDIK_2191 [Cucumispora dikerogammari]
MFNMVYTTNTLCDSITKIDTNNTQCSEEMPKIKYKNLVKEPHVEKNIHAEGIGLKCEVKDDHEEFIIPFNFPSTAIYDYSLECPLLFIPLFKMAPSNKTEINSDFFKEIRQSLILKKFTGKPPGFLYLQYIPGLSTPFSDGVVGDVYLDDINIKNSEENGQIVKSGYFLLTNENKNEVMLYLAVYVYDGKARCSRSRLKDFSAFSKKLFDADSKGPSVFNLQLNISSFTQGLPLLGSGSSKKQKHPYTIHFDKSGLIDENSTLTVELKGDFNCYETEFTIEKKYSNQDLNGMAFTVVKNENINFWGRFKRFFIK